VDRRLLLMHQVMLGDIPRLRAYDAAIARAVRPGDVVVDVGAGTLVLSLMALRHGARHVYALEADPEMAAVAREVARRNRLAGRLTLVQGDARAVQLPEKADVLVAEMMGNLGPEEEMAEIVRDVARANLRPGGQVIPWRLVTQLQPIEFDDEGWGVWRDDFWAGALGAIPEFAPSEAQLHFFSREPKRLGEPVVLADSRLGEPGADLSCRTTLEIDRPGRLQAVIGYFTATLASGVSLSNFPSYPGCNWAVWVWPLRHTDVAPGDRILVEVGRPRDVRLATEWCLDCRIARGSGRASWPRSSNPCETSPSPAGTSAD